MVSRATTRVIGNTLFGSVWPVIRLNTSLTAPQKMPTAVVMTKAPTTTAAMLSNWL